MNIFKKNTEKHTEKLPMTGKVKKGFRIYCTAIMGAALVLGTSVTAFAANDPISVINNLSTFIFGLIRAIGLILLGFGVVQVGLSLKSHDPSQRANGFLTLAGGVIITSRSATGSARRPESRRPGNSSARSLLRQPWPG